MRDPRGLNRLRKNSLMKKGRPSAAKQLAEKVDVGTEQKRNHPSAVKTAAILNDLAARINPGPFKTTVITGFFSNLKKPAS